MRSYAALGRLLLEVFVEVANHATYGSARAALGLGAHGYSAVSTVSLTRTALLKVRCERGGAVLRGDQQLPRGAVRRPAHRAQRVTLHSSAFVRPEVYAREQRYTCNRAIVLNVTRCVVQCNVQRTSRIAQSC